MGGRREMPHSATLLRAVLHDLAQPAASAMLAAEIAALELARGNLQAAEARNAATVELLGTLHDLLQVYGVATSGGVDSAPLSREATDPGCVAAEAIPGAIVMPCPPVAISAALLRLVLRRLSQAFGAEGLTCRVAPASNGATVCIRLSGRAASPVALAPWIALLRLADAKVRSRSGVVDISLPKSAGGGCANGHSLMKR